MKSMTYSAHESKIALEKKKKRSPALADFDRMLRLDYGHPKKPGTYCWVIPWMFGHQNGWEMEVEWTPGGGLFCRSLRMGGSAACGFQNQWDGLWYNTDLSDDER